MLSRFLKYVDKTFHLGELVQKIRDRRVKPRLSTQSVWLSALVMFVLRLGSLHAAGNLLKFPKRLEKLIGAQKPSEDTIGRVHGLMDSETLRDVLGAVHRKVKRNKVLARRWNMRLAALDGHEFFSLKNTLLPVL